MRSHDTALGLVRRVWDESAAWCYDAYPENPQPHIFNQTVRTLEEGGLVAHPTDSCYALGCALDNGSGIERIRRVRQLGDRHHLTLVVPEFSQLGAFMEMDNQAFHVVKAATPGPYTFILKATCEVSKMVQHLEKRTIGIRIPGHRITLTLLDTVGSPLVSSTLLLPDHPKPLAEEWIIKELLDHELDTAPDSGDCGPTLTTVVDPNGDEPEVARIGAGDPGPFE